MRLGEVKGQRSEWVDWLKTTKKAISAYVTTGDDRGLLNHSSVQHSNLSQLTKRANVRKDSTVKADGWKRKSFFFPPLSGAE